MVELVNNSRGLSQVRDLISNYFASLLTGCRKRRLAGRRSLFSGELLEDRVMLTTFVVNTALDGLGIGGAGVTTLREALTAANTNASVDGSLAGDMDGDVILFDSTVFGGGGTINLDVALGDLLISDDVTINGILGSGSGATIVNLNGLGANRLFSINTTSAPGSAIVTLTGLTLQGGDGTGTTAANDGRGGAIYIGSSNAAVRLNSVNIIGNTASGNAATDGGGGIYNNGGRLALTNVMLDGNIANGTLGSGGGVLTTGGLVTASGTSFINNVANRAGGGLEIIAGNFDTGANVVFDSNVAGPTGTASPGNGGAIHLSGSGSFVFLNGTQVTNNIAGREGGGLWNQAGSSLFVRSGSIVSGNEARGAAADDGGGGIFNNGGAIVVFNSEISNNSATGVLGSGGGVFSTSGTFRIDNSQVINNTAIRAGGGLEIVTGIAQFVGTNIDNNDALGSMTSPGNGGGLHVTGLATVYVTGGTVSGNTAALEGGGLWNSTGTMIVRTGTVLDGNTASGDAADDGGGGIFNNGGRLALTDVTLSNNVADGTNGSGGGIFSTGGLVTDSDGMYSRNIANRAGGGVEIVVGTFDSLRTTFDSNVAGPAGSANPGNGGALHVSGNTANVIISAGTVTNNIAAREGGGLWNQTGSRLTVRAGSVITGNTASGAAADDGGGGLFNNGGTLVVVDSTISMNTATGAAGSGGGIFSTAGLVRVDRTMVTGNTAVRAGGGIEIVIGTLTTLNTNLDGNSALGSMAVPGNGGGLHVTGIADVVITGGTVNNNIAALEGGGLWNSIGNMTVQGGSVINGNTASGAAADDGGGGIFNNGGTLRVLDSMITNNVADGTVGSGGGIFSTDGEVTIRNTTLSMNLANRAGGGIEIIDGDLQLRNSNLISNQAIGGAMGAPGNGGGLHVTGTVNTTITGGTVFNNIAASEGGGLWNQTGSTLNVNGTDLFSNTALGDDATNGGGGIFNAGGTVIVANAMIRENFADGAAGSGGGIFNDAGGTINVSNTMITDNIASRAGGGIEDNSGAGLGIILNNVNLDGNATGGPDALFSAPGNGGGLHITGSGDSVISGGTVNGNFAAQEGGGLWNGSGSMTVTGTTINGNTASGAMSHDGGGGIFNNGGTLTVTNGTISNNAADGAAGSGGGVFSTAGTVLLNNTIVSMNNTVRAGGGVEVVDGNLLLIDSDLINNNTNGGGMGVPGNGGGVHVTGTASTVIIGGSVFGNFAAAEGGGLWNQSGTTMTISNVLIIGNTASGDAADQGGGGVFNAGGTVNITNSTIEDNFADGVSGSGGGILNDTGGFVSVTGGSISFNVSNRAGGGIEDNSGPGLGIVLNNVNLRAVP